MQTTDQAHTRPAQEPPAACNTAGGASHAAADALERRARLGIVASAQIGNEKSMRFFQGQLYAAQAMRSGHAATMAARDAEVADEPQTALEAAAAALPVDAKDLTLARVANFLAARCIEVAASAAISHTASTPATFSHTPRPAIAPTTEGHSCQRRFGPGVKPCDYVLQPKDRDAQAMGARLTVYRDAEFDLAEVRINLGVFTGASITARLSPGELREFAARLIDAAHDIETLPSAVLTRSAA